MFALAGSTGFRKAEVALPSGCAFDDRRLSRASVLWRINGVVYADRHMYFSGSPIFTFRIPTAENIKITPSY